MSFRKNTGTSTTDALNLFEAGILDEYLDCRGQFFNCRLGIFFVLKALHFRVESSCNNSRKTCGITLFRRRSERIFVIVGIDKCPDP